MEKTADEKDIILNPFAYWEKTLWEICYQIEEKIEAFSPTVSIECSLEETDGLYWITMYVEKRRILINFPSLEELKRQWLDTKPLGVWLELFCGKTFYNSIEGEEILYQVNSLADPQFIESLAGFLTKKGKLKIDIEFFKKHRLP